jgi:predicted small integral membrane protein
VDLFCELGVLREIVPEGSDTALQALKHVKSLDGSFPNKEITYRIMLTAPVTVAKFSRLKIIKNNLRTTMTQERLGGRAPLSI